MSNDSHMLEAITGEDAVTRGACAHVLATAVGTKALGPTSRHHAPGAMPSEQAAVATAAVEHELTGRAAAIADGSKEILLRQLIELSDQLAQVGATPMAKCTTPWL